MARRASYTTDQLREQLRLGKNLQEIADHFKRNISNISRAVAKLKEQEAQAAWEARGEMVDELVQEADDAGADIVLLPRPSPGRSTDPLPMAVVDEISMWDVKAAAERNYALLGEMLDDSPRARFYVDSKTRVRVLAERRAHLQLAVDVNKAIYSNQQFQRAARILDKLLKKCAPEIRDEFISELRLQLPLAGGVDES